MKHTVTFTAFAFALACALTAPAGAEDVKLVYPSDAAAIELDNSTPAKRIEPPVREESEQDVVTPLGQIRAVLASLQAIEENQEEVARDVAALKKLDVSNLFPVVEKSAEDQKALAQTVDGVALSVKNAAAKIDALQQTVADLRATVESVEKTAASVERIRTSRWTDYCVIAILALVLIQLIWRAVAAIGGGVKARAQKWQEMAAAYELAKKQLAEAKAKENAPAEAK
ncbi:MAG: hypothetical protein ACI4QC_00065 [Thermoguttaceae bacterium]